MADRPHLKAPLEVRGGRLVVVEEDSAEHVLQCARAVLSTPMGSRTSRPEFGLPDGAFSVGGMDPDAVDAALEEWEPRAAVDAISDDAELQEGIGRIIAAIEPLGDTHG